MLITPATCGNVVKQKSLATSVYIFGFFILCSVINDFVFIDFSETVLYLWFTFDSRGVVLFLCFVVIVYDLVYEFYFDVDVDVDVDVDLRFGVCVFMDFDFSCVYVAMCWFHYLVYILLRCCSLAFLLSLLLDLPFSFLIYHFTIQLILLITLWLLHYNFIFIIQTFSLSFL